MQTPRCREGAGSLLSATGAADSPERRRLNPAADRTADGAAFKTRSIEKPLMADSTSAVAIPPVSPADLERAEAFAREPFLLEGEDRDAYRTGGGNGHRPLEELPSGEEEIEGDEELSSEDEPLDWDEAEEEEEERASDQLIDDPNA